MKFAEIIPFRPSGFSNILTYSIEDSNKNIEIGDIAEIALGTKREQCIVINITKTKPEFTTKKLGKIIAKNIFTPQDIKNILDISTYFFTSPSHIIKKVIPSSIRNTRFTQEEKTNNTKKNISRHQQEIQDIQNIDEIHIGSLYSGRTQKEIEFINTITKNKNQQVVIIFPDILSLKQIYKKYIKIFPNICCFHAEVSKKKQIEAFWNIKNASVNIIFATQYSLGFPFPNLGGIIVYEYTHGSHHTKFSPFTSSIEFSKIIAKNKNIPLFLSSSSADIKSIFEAKVHKENIHIYPTLFPEKRKYSIADMNLEYANKNMSPLSEIAKEKIKENFIKNKKTILYINRKGLHHFLQCPDCGYVPLSQYTGNKMNVYKNKDDKIILRCNAMHYGEDIQKNMTCDKCNAQMKHKGDGTQSLEEECKKIIQTKNVKILRIDKDAFHTKSEEKRLLLEIENADIIIGTQMMLSLGSIPNCNTVIDVLFENNLHFFSFKTEENTYIHSKLLEEMLEKPMQNTIQTILIQTFQPNLDLLHHIVHSHTKPLSFYTSEILSRKMLCYPPFSEEFTIEISHKSKEKCNADIQKINILLQKYKYTYESMQSKTMPHLQKYSISIIFFVEKNRKNTQTFPDFLSEINALKIKYILKRNT